MTNERAPVPAGDNTVGAWLQSVQPPPPPALAARIRGALGENADRAAAETSDACLEAGERLLHALLASGSTSRESALDLLAVDALVTYAFEAAANDPGQLETRAARAMVRIAELSPVHDG